MQIKIYEIPQSIVINNSCSHFDEMKTIHDKLAYVNLLKKLEKIEIKKIWEESS